MKYDNSNLIRLELLREMKSGKFSGENRLPRELELAKEYNISRSQLREILAGLEREGFITRLHGVGTVINHHVLDVKNRMDIEVEFMDMIRQNGFEPGISDVTVSEVTADGEIASKLQVMAGSPLLKVTRVCTADGKPAITGEEIAEKLQLSRTLTNEILYRLSANNVITSVSPGEYENPGYIPALPITKMTVLTVLTRYDDITLPSAELCSKSLASGNAAGVIAEFKKAMQDNPANTSVIELLK